MNGECLTPPPARALQVDSGNMGFLFTMVGIIELISGTGIAAAQAGSDREPGDFALDPLKFCADPELKVGGQRWMAADEWRLPAAAFFVCGAGAAPRLCTQHNSPPPPSLILSG